MMTVMIIAVLLVVGLCFGSFVNALVWRLHEQAKLADKPKKSPAKGPTAEQLSIAKGRSMCPHCYHPLATKDLIPVVSWLMLRGKCRYCHKSIPDNPVSELLVPALFIISYVAWPESLHANQPAHIAHFVVWLIVLVGFVALTLYDFRWYLLPNRIVYPLIAVSGLWALSSVLTAPGGQHWERLWAVAGAVAVSSGIFYVLYQVSNEHWIGGGDVKLGLVIGFMVGSALHGMLVLFISALLGTLAALPGIVAGKVGRNSRLAFGPFLMAATVIVVLFGTNLVDWYQRLFGL